MSAYFRSSFLVQECPFLVSQMCLNNQESPCLAILYLVTHWCLSMLWPSLAYLGYVFLQWAISAMWSSVMIQKCSFLVSHIFRKEPMPKSVHKFIDASTCLDHHWRPLALRLCFQLSSTCEAKILSNNVILLILSNLFCTNKPFCIMPHALVHSYVMTQPVMLCHRSRALTPLRFFCRP
jgi:hypothetical protein